MNVLGNLYRDQISGFQGVAVAHTFWLYGCERITLSPQSLSEGKIIPNETFDAKQLELVKPSVVVGFQHTSLGNRPPAGPTPAPTRSADPK